MDVHERRAEHMDDCAVLAGIFLRWTGITGLLGINVAGFPGSEWPWAFAAVTLLLVAGVAGELLRLRRLHWF